MAAANPGQGDDSPDTWFIGIDAWIIQDGNYPDFSVGQSCGFAVEFALEGDFAESSRSPCAHRLTDDRYDVVARVATIDADVNCYVLDIGGLMIYRSRVPGLGHFRRRDIVHGIVRLGVDPFDYFERLGLRQDMPPLIYRWTVVSVSLQHAPWIESSPRVFERDLNGWRWVQVAATNAWSDDEGRAEYLLECRLDEPEPTFPRIRP